MKILQVTNFFKPSWESGGPARVAYDISKELIGRGHDVTVYTTDGFKTRLNVEKNKPSNVDGIKTYYFENLSSYFASEFVFPLPYYSPIIAKKEIKDFDIIHIHEHRTMLAAIVCYYAKKYNIPYVLQAHGSVLPFFQRQDLKRIFDRFFGYEILNNASKLIALNKSEVEQYKLMSVQEEKIQILPNGIDLANYTKLPAKGNFKVKYGIERNEKVVLYVGRLHQSKGIELLLDAFSGLSNIIDNSKLILVGPDDNYRTNLEDKIKMLNLGNKVILTGFVSNDEKKMAFIDSDVFVTPSFSGFPITFLESCACGTPIITTNCRDRLDWIHNKVGYVVEYDGGQMRDAMLKILTDDTEKSRFGLECKRIATDVFSWPSIITQIEHTYKDLVH